MCKKKQFVINLKIKRYLSSYRSTTKLSVSALIDLIIGVTVECALPKRISPLT
jgi:hypothetical protein